MLSLKRIRVSTVYALLIASICLSLVIAIMIYTELLKEAPAGETTLTDSYQLIHYQIAYSSGISFSFFAFFALACSLALSSIIRRDKANARLLSKLRTTNRQLDQEVQIRTNQLTEAIKAKDHFMGIAAHDLKAPLSGIEGLVELIRMENRNMSAKQSEYLGHIQYSCKKMQKLIVDILDLNRIEQGKAMMDWQNVSITKILDQIRFVFAGPAARKDIDLCIEGIDATLETDPDSVIRILENLVSNAIKFSPAGKKVSLSVRSEHHQIEFKVSDEGPGILQDEQSKIFSKFQRLSNRPTNSEISTGLGLSIVKELTVQLGGEVTFDSTFGKGSTFIVVLPRYKQRPQLGDHRVAPRPVIKSVPTIDAEAELR